MNFNVKRLDRVSLFIILAVFATSIPLIYGGVTIDIAEKNISDNDPTTSNAQGPQMAVNGSIIYMVWYNGTDANNCSQSLCDIVLVKSTDNGTTFSTPIIIGNSTSTSNIDPQIAVGSGNNVYVVWQNGTNVELVTSSDGGASFTTFRPPFSITVDSVGAKPQIVTNSSGNNVYIAWSNKTDYQIRTSDDDGATFATALDIGDHGTGSSRRSISLAVSTDTVYAVMQDELKINFTRSTNNGTTFVKPTTPSNGEILSLLSVADESKLSENVIVSAKIPVSSPVSSKESVIPSPSVDDVRATLIDSAEPASVLESASVTVIVAELPVLYCVALKFMVMVLAVTLERFTSPSEVSVVVG